MTVTVAIVDSGVYFSPNLLTNYSYQDLLTFLAQANFANGGKYPITVASTTQGTQNPGYCLQNQNYSNDKYGHGSHVAGIVGNRYIDQATGNYLGVAPEANILSVRVLEDNGTGSYETVIKGVQYHDWRTQFAAHGWKLGR